MSISPSTVTNSIAALSISGVTIKDLDEIKQEFFARDCPVLFPSPSNPISDLSIKADSFGGASAKKTCTYTLNYVFLYAEIGTTRGLVDIAMGWVDTVALIYDAFAANDYLTGCIDIYASAISMTTLQDPSGKTFYGANIPLRAMEFVN